MSVTGEQPWERWVSINLGNDGQTKGQPKESGETTDQPRKFRVYEQQPRSIRLSRPGALHVIPINSSEASVVPSRSKGLPKILKTSSVNLTIGDRLLPVMTKVNWGISRDASMGGRYPGDK